MVISGPVTFTPVAELLTVELSLPGLMTSVAFRILTVNLPHTTRRLLPSVSFTFKRNQLYINLSVHLLYSLLTILMFLISSGFSVRFSIVSIGVLCIQAGKNREYRVKNTKVFQNDVTKGCNSIFRSWL